MSRIVIAGGGVAGLEGTRRAASHASRPTRRRWPSLRTSARPWSRRPFRPVMRGMLLDPVGADYVDGRHHELSTAPLWWPPAKVATRHLGAYLAACAGHHEVATSTAPSSP
jgi:hypothetical protein